LNPMYSTENSTVVFDRLLMVNVPSSSVKSPEIICPFAEMATDAKPTGSLVVFSVIFPFIIPLPLVGCCAQELAETAIINDRVKYFFFIIVGILYQIRQCIYLNYCLMN